MAMGMIGLVGLGAGAGMVLDPMTQHKMIHDDGIQIALAEQDYDGFVSALAAIDAEASISEEEFDLLVDNYDRKNALDAALEADDYDAFLSVLEEVNPNRADRLTEEQFARMSERHQSHAAVEAAVEAGDYQAWVEAVSASPHGDDIAELISEDDFATFVEMHEARESGDFDTADELREELGLPERGPGKEGRAGGKEGGPGGQGDHSGRFLVDSE